MSLSSILTRKAVTVVPKDSLSHAAKLMETNNVGAVVVTVQRRAVGMVTDRDLAMAVCVRGLSPDIQVQDVMTCPVTTIREDEGIFEATRRLMELAVRRLPVVDERESVIGLVSLDDLLLLLSRELHNMSEGIRTGAPAQKATGE